MFYVTELIISSLACTFTSPLRHSVVDWTTVRVHTTCANATHRTTYVLSARIPFIGGLQEPGFSMALLPLIATKRYWKLFPMIGKARLDMTGVLRLGARAHFCPESA